MTAESNTKFMETAISQKILFLGLIILIFTVITSTWLGVALMCYILFFGIRYTLYMSSASRLPPQKVVATCHVMFGWRNGGWARGFNLWSKWYSIGTLQVSIHCFIVCKGNIVTVRTCLGLSQEFEMYT